MLKEFFDPRLFPNLFADNDRLKGCVIVVILKMVAWFLLALLLIILLILFTKIKIDLTYKFEPKDQRLTIVIKALFGLFRYRIDFPQLEVEGKEENKKEFVPIDNVLLGKDANDEEEVMKAYRPIKEWLKIIKELNQLVKKALKKVRITKLEWKSALGTGNAATTGIVGGTGWIFKGTVLGVISNYFSLKVKPQLEITPIFNRKISNTYIKCIFQVRAGQAILAGIKLFKFWKKMKSNHPFADKNETTKVQPKDQTV